LRMPYSSASVVACSGCWDWREPIPAQCRQRRTKSRNLKRVRMGRSGNVASGGVWECSAKIHFISLNYFYFPKIPSPHPTPSTPIITSPALPSPHSALPGLSLQRGGGKQLLDLGVAALHRLVEGGRAIVQVLVGVGAVVEQRPHGADMSLLRRRDERCRAVR
jgi:hypothetical protein